LKCCRYACIISAVVLVVFWLSELFFQEAGLRCYQTYDGQFRSFECEFKGVHYDHVVSDFDEWKKEHPDQNMTLYRCFQPNLFNVFSLWDYLTHPRWDLPYLNDEHTEDCKTKESCSPCVKNH